MLFQIAQSLAWPVKAWNMSPLLQLLLLELLEPGVVPRTFYCQGIEKAHCSEGCIQRLWWRWIGEWLLSRLLYSFLMVLRALFSSLVAIGRILMFLPNAKQMGLVNCLYGQGVRDVAVSDRARRSDTLCTINIKVQTGVVVKVLGCFLQSIHPIPWVQSPADLFLVYQWGQG